MFASTISAAFLALALQGGAAGSGDVSIRVSGSGQWSVSCTFETDDGVREEAARGRGTSDFDRLSANDVQSAECAYATDERAFLTVRFIEAEGFACPFDPEADIDECQLTVPGGANGGFQLER